MQEAFHSKIKTILSYIIFRPSLPPHITVSTQKTSTLDKCTANFTLVFQNQSLGKETF